MLAVLIGVGIFFNNFNLDLAFDSWRKQATFWQAFTRRLPTLPEKSTVIIAMDFFNRDVYPIPIYDTEFDQEYDCEFPLNLLYAKSKNAGEFLTHTVLPVFFKTEASNDDITITKLFNSLDSDTPKLNFQSIHHGKRIIDPNNLIVVGYDGREVLVNREILQRYAIYDKLMDRDFPTLTNVPVQYPLRYKLNGFY